MNKKRVDKDIIALLISTLVTLGVWVGFEIYRAYTKVSVPTGVEDYLTPLTPTLDTKVLDILEERSR